MCNLLYSGYPENPNRSPILPRIVGWGDTLPRDGENGVSPQTLSYCLPNGTYRSQKTWSHDTAVAPQTPDILPPRHHPAGSHTLHLDELVVRQGQPPERAPQLFLYHQTFLYRHILRHHLTVKEKNIGLQKRYESHPPISR
jgi:hypothetical protein